jgi:hypothetical protein
VAKHLIEPVGQAQQHGRGQQKTVEEVDQVLPF